MAFTDLRLASDPHDPLFEDAARLVIEKQNGSVSFLQRQQSIGYARAARILDELHQAGIIGPAEGAKPRDILFPSYEAFLKSQSPLPPQPEPDYSNYQIPKITLSAPEHV